MPATATRYRVDDLAERTATSIDTIRFYQKRGLLPAPLREGRIAWYDDTHIDRIARIRDLQGQGLPLALIGRLLDLDATDAPLATAVLEATHRGATTDHRLTRDELATTVGVPIAIIDAIVREGILTPQTIDGRDYFEPADATLVRQGLKLLEFGIPMPALLEIAREQTEMTQAIAEHAVELFDAHVRQPLRNAPLSDDEKATLLVDAFNVLLPTASELVADHFRRVLLDVAQARLDIDLTPSERSAS